MPTNTATLDLTMNLAGRTFTGKRAPTADGEALYTPATNLGKAGTITTGTVTLAEGHGFTNSDVVDVFWAAGSRTGCVVGSAGSTTLALTGGTGDTLPTGGTAVTLTEIVTVTCPITAANLAALAAACTSRALVSFIEGDATEHPFDIAAGEALMWDSSSNLANPLSGLTIATVTVSTDATTADSETGVGPRVYLGTLHDSTP